MVLPTSEFSNDLKLQVNQNQWSSRVAKAKGLATQLRSESIGQIGFFIRASPEKLVGSAPRGRPRTARGRRRGSKSKSHRAMLSIRAREGTQGVVTRSFSVRLRSALGRGGTRESVAFRSRISARSVGRRIALFYPRAVKIYLTRLKIQHWIWRGVSGRAHTAGGSVCNLGSGPW